MVQFTETVLRDANQSLIPTRLPFDKFEPILSTINRAGYYSAEVWGGATFDVCLRFLGEDPWERLRKIRAAMPDTKLQMLLRGQNILGYSHYPNDIVRRFVRKSVENGIDIIRIFDALNDTDNLKVAVEETVKSGAIASCAISYTTSPVHTLEKYVELGTAQTAPNASSVAKGMFWAGALGAALGAAATQSFSGDIAIYFKDGKKCVIRLFHPNTYQALKSKLFVL
jgi:pyruvate/oxaloacetate carboxyltransferase